MDYLGDGFKCYDHGDEFCGSSHYRNLDQHSTLYYWMHVAKDLLTEANTS